LIDAATAATATLTRWRAGRPLARCFNVERGPLAFNPTARPARFRPFLGSAGAVVPTAYAGEDWLIAVAETVLRDDLPRVGARRVLSAVRLRGIAVAQLAYAEDLTLVQLNGYGLRKLDLTRADCIDTGPAMYPQTAALAHVLHDAQPQAQGLLWTSHQSDHGDAVILWESRLDRSWLAQIAPPLRLDSRPGLEHVREACENAGVLLEL